MTQTRSLLLIAWLFLAGWLFLKWNEFSAAPVAATGAEAPVATAGVADTPAAMPATLPGAAPTGVVDPAALPGIADVERPDAAPAATALVHLRNDVVELALDAQGSVVESRLLGYRQLKSTDSPEVRLLDVGPGGSFTATTGVIDSARKQYLVADFQPTGTQRDYVLPTGAAELRVPLAWNDPNTGLRMQRVLVLERGSYLLRFEDTYENTSAAHLQLNPYVQLTRTAPPPVPKTSGFTNPESFAFIGAAWYDPEGKFNKTPLSKFEDETPPQEMVDHAWIGMLQHHFFVAWVPAAEEKQKISTTTVPGGAAPQYRIQSYAAALDLAPGASSQRRMGLWVGPKLQKPLDAIAPGLKLALDYGKLTFISQPLFDYVLRPLHALTGNWGWAIILTVLALKLALYPLSAAQFKSMAKLRSVQPRIEALKERHGEDKQAFQMAMMDLYKKEKINPVGGCLPVLIPLPIFFALYWVLLETVELRQAPWIGWIQNLTAPDPYFILPVLNLGVMFLTQRMTPTPGMDPMQKKMMAAMPLVFGVMMAFFPAGLVLYWVSNGLLGLLQQWWIQRQNRLRPALAR